MANVDCGMDEVNEVSNGRVVFDNVCIAVMTDDGRLKRVHDSSVSLEILSEAFKAEINVFKGEFRVRMLGRGVVVNRVTVLVNAALT